MPLASLQPLPVTRLLAGLAFGVVALGLIASCGDDSRLPEAPVNAQAAALVVVDDAPADIGCIRVTATGEDRVVQLSANVIPGRRTTISASGLPTGYVTFVAEAFTKPCAQLTAADLSTWRSDPITQILGAGTTTMLSLTLRKNGIADVTFKFTFARACVPGGNQCEASELCFVLACGDASGGCLDRPTTCSLHYEPVCGCNGVTYQNSCEAAKAGTSVNHEGPCACGGPAKNACPTGFYCAFSSGTCGVADRVGVCSAPPAACPAATQPVCGCDGKTYGNACLAAAARQSVAHDGACPPKVCGGPSGIRCDDFAQYCSFPDGTCNDPNRFGVCMTRPSACPIRYSPVCACNGNEYQSDCRAFAVGLSLANRGPCPTSM